MRSTPRPAVLVMAALVAVAPLTGCGGSDKPKTEKLVATQSTPPPAPAYDQIPAEQRTQYLAALQTIDPTITAKVDRALSRGVGICYALWEGKTGAKLTAYVEQSFNLDEGKAVKVSQAAQRFMCSSKQLRDHHKKVTGRG